MRDAAGVHVLAHQTVTEDGVGEGGIANGGALARADDRGAALRKLRRDAIAWRLHGSSQSLERAGQEVDQADLGFGHHFGRQRSVVDLERRAREPAGERRTAQGCAVVGHGHSPLSS